MRLSRGTQLDNLVSGITYRIDRFLGKGGFGTTYLAHRASPPSSEPVCLKVTNDARVWHGEAYFADLLTAVGHTVRFIDAFPTTVRVRNAKKMIFVIEMEYVEHGTVWDATEDGRLPWTEKQVSKKIRGLLKPLAQLHNMGVSHRDITPQNTFIGNRATLKLGDFGISRASLHVAGVKKDGKQAPDFFMPRDAGVWWRPADDMYQVGLLTMTMLTGELMGNHVRMPDVTAATSRGYGLRPAVKNCLRVKAQRVQTAEDLLAQLPR